MPRARTKAGDGIRAGLAEPLDRDVLLCPRLREPVDRPLIRAGSVAVRTVASDIRLARILARADLGVVGQARDRADPVGVADLQQGGVVGPGDEELLDIRGGLFGLADPDQVADDLPGLQGGPGLSGEAVAAGGLGLANGAGGGEARQGQ